jgi:hypothetical protein
MLKRMFFITLVGEKNLHSHRSKMVWVWDATPQKFMNWMTKERAELEKENKMGFVITNCKII